jgi:NAD(P)-dependent dehydrogenase (short-subunit alcohol dehydrogenase family)/rhamnose utilization protein RhaD (predicted bifunctional aldolase and dehydrogenase)
VNMNQQIKDLIEISRFYGANKNFVIAGGGNTSFKDENTIWIKASGYPLAELTEAGLVALSREKLHEIAAKVYSEDPVEREEQVKNDLSGCIIDPAQKNRPSVETSLHEMIRYKFIVHLHPSLVNGVLCSRNAKHFINQHFGEKVLFVPYTDPGYTLFKKLEKDISDYRIKFQADPKIILLENHGVFAGADTINEIKEIYDDIITTIEKHIQPLSSSGELPDNPLLRKTLPVIRMLLSDKKPKVIRHRHNTLIANYYINQQEYHKISLPLIPDIIVYCKSRFLYIEQSSTADKILDSIRGQLPRFLNEYGYLPKVIVIKNLGIFAVDDNCSSAETVLDVFEDNIRICHYALQNGGIKFLSPEQVNFIDKWEAESYRRKIAKQDGKESKLADRIVIVTGGAQGFGAGIAEALFRLNANIVVADVNEEAGNKLVSRLMKEKTNNRAVFVQTDVSDPDSVKELITRTVSEFGGLDIMVSNAGVLQAGGLDEMEPEIFKKVTGINYNGYYYCTKYASEVMKQQNEEKPDYFSDIIQINSKSGLRGSNRNFTYAGAKFGGIGLTQSFAMELAPFKIKVNAICPGNFYEGPLWSDPHSGLFVQYLKAGKVPGAKTIEDVRKYYEEQVPMKRGCRLDDVMKALLYIIDQDYETGQALPVTGGQVMLS